MAYAPARLAAGSREPLQLGVELPTSLPGPVHRGPRRRTRCCVLRLPLPSALTRQALLPRLPGRNSPQHVMPYQLRTTRYTADIGSDPMESLVCMVSSCFNLSAICADIAECSDHGWIVNTLRKGQWLKLQILARMFLA